MTGYTDPAALPWLLIIITLIAFLLSPVLSGIARYREHESDKFGLELTRKNEAMATAFFENPTESVKGWERAVDAQARILKAVTELEANERSTGAIAIVSHGAVGTLLYCTLAGKAISRRWDQPANGGGNYYAVHLSPRLVQSHWRAFDQSAA